MNATRLNYAIERWDMDYDLSAAKIKPNYMQKKALKELNRYRAIGVNRALTIASAGARFILMTGRNTLKLQGFGPVFSYVHWMPGAGKRGINFFSQQ